ncbi:MAG: FIG00936276: hypothetical protein [uncultured Sulfurovum sp.]|uniref:DUF324 domain-containing protein n=1 Tax=uncultured Sulfurovum sp. TaxID=269237 RepID=A0A6S6U6I4_9BACT|nr:MAG: FIG00936276: hypothetical protein [uncultured Sulfurovum sp.]
MNEQESKFKTTFTLKQHTPLIHFQSDQSGATLRATELKPKLDRFLLEHVEGIPFKTNAKGHRSLDYKVKIVYKGKVIKDFPKPYVKRGDEGYIAPYFSDGTSIETDKTESIELSFISFNQDILDAIEKYIALFFTFENFGTRQSKGFGSFHLEKTSKKEFEELLLKSDNAVFQLTKNASSGKDSLKIVDEFYKHLKMGQRTPYDKSLLFQYMCTKSIGWEKKFLKNKFPEIIHGTHQPIACKEPEDKEFKYIRAVLGLAEHNEYRPGGGKKQIKIESVERDEKDSSKAKYQRFKSPITFKIFNGSIYLIYNKSYEEILNKEFYFKLNGKKEELFTPKTFDMYGFLKFVETKVSYLKELK